MLCWFICVCFFKQKTAYEMRISDWSSDVCSSDLKQAVEQRFRCLTRGRFARAHDAINIGERMIAIFRLVCLQRVAHPGASSNMINIEQLEMVDPRLVELLKIFRRHLIARFDLNLAGSLVDEIIGAVTAKYFL